MRHKLEIIDCNNKFDTLWLDVGLKNKMLLTCNEKYCNVAKVYLNKDSAIKVVEFLNEFIEDCDNN